MIDTVIVFRMVNDSGYTWGKLCSDDSVPRETDIDGERRHRGFIVGLIPFTNAVVTLEKRP